MAKVRHSSYNRQEETRGMKKMKRMCRSFEGMSLDTGNNKKKLSSGGGGWKKTARLRRLVSKQSGETKPKEYYIVMMEDWRYDDEESAKLNYIKFLQSALSRENIEIVSNTKKSFNCCLSEEEKRVLEEKKEVMAIEIAGCQYTIGCGDLRFLPSYGPEVDQGYLFDSEVEQQQQA